MKTKADSGRKGGTVTLQRYGRTQLAEWGKRGGRPKAQTYDDIRRQQLIEQNNKTEVMGFPGTLKEQKKLFAARQRSNGVTVTSTEQAGTAQVNPTQAVPAERSETRL